MCEAGGGNAKRTQIRQSIAGATLIELTDVSGAAAAEEEEEEGGGGLSIRERIALRRGSARDDAIARSVSAASNDDLAEQGFSPGNDDEGEEGEELVSMDNPLKGAAQPGGTGGLSPVRGAKLPALPALPASEAHPGHRFVPSEWRRCVDAEGHTYYTHFASKACTYAMPWVLTADDLDPAIHDANDPAHWRAVQTGGHRPDGTAIVLYYNTVTRQSTFDTPLFAAWADAADQRRNRRRGKSGRRLRQQKEQQQKQQQGVE